ncbi:MAG: tetratricopeptide repeat protein, partial [Parcubacteria group bacterium]
IQPMLANTKLISALSALQQQNIDGPLVTGHFRSAYETSRLGRPEVVEQIASNAVTLLTSKMTMEEKNVFFEFARQVVIKQAEDFSQDARHQIVAGSFLSTTGALDEALAYLDRARELMPGKQIIYLEIANAYLNKGEKDKAIEVLRYVGEISPDHKDQMEEYIRQIQQG